MINTLFFENTLYYAMRKINAYVTGWPLYVERVVTVFQTSWTVRFC